MRLTPSAIRRSSDDGTNLVELIVAVALTSVLGAMVLAASVATHKSLRVADDSTRGQEDIGVVVDRLGRDVRDARGVVCDGASSDPTCSHHLQLWIDGNANYKQDVGETVTWSLQLGADGVHYDVVRTTDGGTSQVQSRTIVKNVGDIGFTYADVAPTSSQPAPGVPATRSVTVDVNYDAVTGSGTASRQLKFTTLLRNVA